MTKNLRLTSRTMWPALVAATTAFLLVGCEKEYGVDEFLVDEAGTHRLVCLNGAGGDAHPGNLVVDELCASLPGLIRDCQNDDCRATFRSTDVDAVVAALSTVFPDDTRPIAVIGYSYGGVNMMDVARRLAFNADGSERDDAQRVARMVLLDAFSPFAAASLDVPSNVDDVWSYRHSKAPPEDCSRERPVIGPYEGKGIRCTESSRCVDHDWSLGDVEDTLVDHCTVPAVSQDAVRINIVDGEDAGTRVRLPPLAPVGRL